MIRIIAAINGPLTLIKALPVLFDLTFTAAFYMDIYYPHFTVGKLRLPDSQWPEREVLPLTPKPTV